MYYTAAAEKELGVVIDQNVKFHQHAAAVAAKASYIQGLIIIISKHFECFDVDLCQFIQDFILEYVWGLHYITDQKLTENVSPA